MPLYKLVYEVDGGQVKAKPWTNGLAVKMDLTKDPSSPSSYETFDIASLGVDTGFCDGIAIDGYEYFSPAGGHPDGGARVLSGELVRYHSTGAFTSASSWEHFDLASLDPDAIGFQTVAYIAPYLYILPYFNTKIVRYDTGRAFTDPGAYQVFDLQRVTAEPWGFIGGVVAGNRLALIPWIDPVHLHSTESHRAPRCEPRQAVHRIRRRGRRSTSPR